MLADCRSTQSFACKAAATSCGSGTGFDFRYSRPQDVARILDLILLSARDSEMKRSDSESESEAESEASRCGPIDEACEFRLGGPAVPGLVPRWSWTPSAKDGKAFLPLWGPSKINVFQSPSRLPQGGPQSPGTPRDPQKPPRTPREPPGTSIDPPGTARATPGTSQGPPRDPRDPPKDPRSPWRPPRCTQGSLQDLS